MMLLSFALYMSMCAYTLFTGGLTLPFLHICFHGIAVTPDPLPAGNWS